MRRHWRKTTMAVAAAALAVSAVAATASATTEPDETEPAGTEAEGTAPDVTEVVGTEAEGTEAEGTEPEGTEAEGDALVVYDESALCGTDEYGGNLATLAALDELTVELTLCNPDAALPSKVAFASLGISPSEQLDDPEALINEPIGTGPYRVATWERGSQIVFEAFEDYWGEPAVSPTVVLQWNTEAAQRLVQLEAGTAHGIDNVGTDDFARVDENEDLQLVNRDPMNVLYLGLNNTVEPFDDPLVREAIALAIDRQRLVDDFYPEGSVAATQFIPPSVPGHNPDFVDFEFNPDEARALLEEAGFADGLEVDFQIPEVTRPYLPASIEIATDIQQQLAEVGITANIDVQEFGAFLDTNREGGLEMYLLGWIADWPDPSNFLDFHFGRNARPAFGEGFPEVHEALDEAGRTVDPDERLAIYDQVNGLLAENIPMIPIAYGGSALAYQATVDGAHSSPLANEELARMGIEGEDALVFVQNGEPDGLYCGDETSGESFRACRTVSEALLAYELGGTEVIPALAESFDVNDEATVWTFHLREGVTFHDGSAFDAVDVVESYRVQWDAADPRHVGRQGTFDYFPAIFGDFLNPPAGEE